MKGGEMVLNAQLLLKNRIGAYIVWIINEVKITANNLKIRSTLRNAFCKQLNTQVI
jgi:hypothetical protein